MDKQNHPEKLVLEDRLLFLKERLERTRIQRTQYGQTTLPKEITLPPSCPYCQDSGYQDLLLESNDTVKSKCDQCSYWPSLYQASSGLGRHAICTLDNFDFERLCIPKVAVKRGAISEDKAEVWCVGEAALKEMAIRSYADNILENTERGRGLYLYGNYGAGKSHISAAIINRACEQRIPAKRINEDEFVRLSMKSIEDEAAEAQLESLTHVPLLVIDEFCGSRHKEGAAGYVAGELQSLIDQRYRDRKATIYTSNYALEQLVGEFKAGIISRIRETCLTIIFYATDYRLDHPGNMERMSSQERISEAARS